MTDEFQRILDILRQENIPELDDSEWLTTREWARRWGVSEEKVRKTIRELLDKGLMAVASREGMMIDGRRYRAPVYALRKPDA